MKRDKNIQRIMWKTFDREKISDEEHFLLIKALKSGDKSDKIYISRALSKIGNPDDLKYILPLMNMQNNTLTFIEAIGMYGIYVIEPLLDKLENESFGKKHLRENIIRVFAYLSRENGDERVNKVAAPLFLKYINDDFSGVRCACLKGIENLMLPEAIPYLMTLIEKDTDEIVIRYAGIIQAKLIARHS